MTAGVSGAPADLQPTDGASSLFSQFPAAAKCPEFG